MKKGLYFVYGFIIIAFIVLFFYATNFKQSKQGNEYNQIIFEDSLVASKNIIQGQYDRDKSSIILVFLSTHCDYCTGALSSLISNAKNIESKYQLFLVFSESAEMINQYLRNFQIEALQNKIIYSDNTRTLNQLFKVKTVPSIFVVNHKKIVENGLGSDEINQIIRGLK